MKGAFSMDRKTSVRPDYAAALAAFAASTRDVADLVERRTEALTAAEEVAAALRDGDLAATAERTADEMEILVVGRPEQGPLGMLVARVVVTTDAKRGLPRAPIQGMIVRLTDGGREFEERKSNAVGLVRFELPKKAEGSYELEVLGPDRQVIERKSGAWTDARPSPVHYFELPRIDALQAFVERARPFETAILEARKTAVDLRARTEQLLKERQLRLAEYVADLDAAIAAGTGSGGCGSEAKTSIETKTGALQRTKERPSDKRRR